MKLHVEAVDPFTLSAVRDVTGITDLGESTLTWDESDMGATGHLKYAGNRAFTRYLLRISADTSRGTIALGTYFAIPGDVKFVGEIMTGTLDLSSPLLGLSSTLTTSAYALNAGTTATSVITLAGRRCGRQVEIPSRYGEYRYADTIIYEAGTPWLQIAQEAAASMNARLVCDELGRVSITRPRLSETLHLTTQPGVTTLIANIEKTSSFATSPSRIIASYSDNNSQLEAVVNTRPLFREDQASGRHIDQVLSIRDLADPSYRGLLSAAREQAAASIAVEDEWTVKTTLADIAGTQPGDRVEVIDVSAHERFVGVVAEISTSLDPLLTTTVNMRGTVA